MKKELEFQIPKGYIVDKEKSTDEKIVYVLNEKETYRDVAKRLFDGKAVYYITEMGLIGNVRVVACGGFTDGNNSTTKEQLESILALNMLCNVAKDKNGDWIPNWNDKAENKWKLYTIYGDDIRADVYGISNTGGVAFRTYEAAMEAIEILGEDIIMKALTLNHLTTDNYKSIGEAALNLNLKYGTLRAMLNGQNKNKTNLIIL